VNMNLEKICRVLIYRLGSLGDTIVALPSFHLVRETFPRAHVTLLTNVTLNSKAAPVASILEGTRLVDDYIEYPGSLRDPRRIAKLRAQIWRRGFDCLIYLAEPRGGVSISLRDALFFLSCGIFRQIGVPYRRRDLYCLPVPGTEFYRPESERLVGNLTRLGQPDLNDNRWWDLHLSADERRVAEDFLGGMDPSAPLLAVSMGTKAQVKDWTEPNWVRLLRELDRHYPDYGLVALGSQDESARSDRILVEWSGPKRNLCGATGPRVSAAILERATLFIGHDSGPMHLAACVGTPCVAIFAARNLPGQWYPRGQNHHIIYNKIACYGCMCNTCYQYTRICILSITVEEVFYAVVNQLSRRPTRIEGRFVAGLTDRQALPRHSIDTTATNLPPSSEATRKVAFVQENDLSDALSRIPSRFQRPGGSRRD